MAFAPADKPTIAVAAIVENAGFGAAHAAPMVRRVFDYWLLGEYPSEADLALLKHGKAGAPIKGKQRKAAEVALLPNQGTLVLSESGLITEKEVPPVDEVQAEDAAVEKAAAPANAKSVSTKPANAATKVATSKPLPKPTQKPAVVKKPAL